MENKRVRTANYSVEEMALLLNLVEKYKSLVENKKTDHVTWAEKKTAWEKIESNFNACSPSNIFRSADSLKKHYENKKSSVKKQVATEKVMLLKTGGGAYVPKYDPLQELTLSVMNPTTVYGLKNCYDSDSQKMQPEDNGKNNEEMIQPEDDRNNEEIISIVCEDENEIDEENCKSPHDLILNKGRSCLKEKEKNEDLNTWKKYTPSSLKQPVSEALLNKIKSVKRKSTDERKTDVPAKSWVQRRRPVSGVLHGLQSSHLANTYSKLAESKQEIAAIQLAILREEQLSKRKENELKENILQVELQIKQKQLLLLNRNSF